MAETMRLCRRYLPLSLNSDAEMSLTQSSQLNGTANVVCDCSQQVAEGLRAGTALGELSEQLART